jgi:branched-chain amino acid transport system substrate-binding protein
MLSMKIKFKGLAIFLVFAAFLGNILFFAGCTKQEPEKYKIGVILPLTGNLAIFGEGEKNAIDLALADLKEDWGEKQASSLQVIYEDSMGNPKNAITAANKLQHIDNVDALVTTFSNVSHAVAPLTKKNETIQMILAMDPLITKANKYSFRIYPNMWQEAELISQYVKEIGPKKVAILSIHISSYEMEINKLLKPNLAKLGSELVSWETFESTDRDIKPQLIKIMNAKPELLILFTYPHQNPMIFKALNELNILGKVDLLGNMSFGFDLQIPDTLLEGVVFIAPSFVVRKEAGTNLFVNNYKKRYGKTPTFDAAFTYDSFRLLVETAKQTGFDKRKVADALLGTKPCSCIKIYKKEK